MEGIEHRTLNANGINMHVAEKGKGPVVLFLHGFPELWYTWRHQIVAFADLGYRAVAPDLRGYTCLHVVGDLVALIESLGVESVFLVAHDWGAMIGWYLCLFRPDLVKAYVCLGVPFRPRHPKMKPIPTMRAFFGNDYYMCRFQDHRPPCLPKENPFAVSVDVELPLWLSQDDLKYYSTKFDQKGFTNDVPMLDDVVVLEGAAHFINQERAQETNSHIHDFLQKF
ncbi:unnamed protein product [Withania somnifera]